jgi:hypothetical protein
MPLLLVLLFLIFEVGRLFGSWLIITNAAREGARYAAVQCVPAGVTPGQTCGAGVDPTSSIEQRVVQTAQFLVLQTTTACTVAAGGAITVPANNTSCINVTYSIASDGTNDGIVTVSVAYNVQTLMPITGNVPFLGAINYPGTQQVNGTSSMRLEQ